MTLTEFRYRWQHTALIAGLALGPLVLSAVPAGGQEDAPPLPQDKIVVDIDAPDEEVFRIGVPNLLGDPKPQAANGGAVLQNDFRLMPGFRVIGPQSVRHDYQSVGLGVDLGAWSTLGANGVIKGQVFGSDAALSVELRFYQSSGGAVPALRRTYRGPATEMRKWMHSFVNEVIGVVTGMYGPFGTEIAFARKHGPGHKSVYAAE